MDAETEKLILRILALPIDFRKLVLWFILKLESEKTD